MRQELNINELDSVVGGSIVITDRGSIAFTTLREAFKLKNVTWQEARSFVEQMLDAHPEMKDKQFDTFIKTQFLDNGWI